MITVVKPGLLTTIQDKGRWGYQAYGMPVAGVMDRYAYRIVNVLVGNECDAAVIEMTMLGATFHFAEETRVAIGGADMQATLNGETVKNWSTFSVPSGSELAFGYASEGCRSYLAIYGGIDVPLVLGSRSTYTRGGIGGIDGKGLQTGTIFSSRKTWSGKHPLQVLPDAFIPRYKTEWDVRVILGPQDDLFTEEGIHTFFTSTYTISADADRMGYRLEGEPIAHLDKADIISDALCQGAIQIPGHGMPIIMMADRQTTGGYAKIGTVIGPDLALLAQAKPGDQVRFILCSDEEGVTAFAKEEGIYDQIQNWQQTPLSTKGRKFILSIDGEQYNVEVEEC